MVDEAKIKHFYVMFYQAKSDMKSKSKNPSSKMYFKSTSNDKGF